MTLFRVEPNGTSTRVASVQTGQGTTSANGPRLTRGGFALERPLGEITGYYYAEVAPATTRKLGRQNLYKVGGAYYRALSVPTSALPDHLRGGSCRNSTKPRAAYLQRQARDHRWHGRQRRPRRHTGSGCDRRPRWERLAQWSTRQRRDLRRHGRGLHRWRPRARTPCSARRAGTCSQAARGRTDCSARRASDALREQRQGPLRGRQGKRLGRRKWTRTAGLRGREVDREVRRSSAEVSLMSVVHHYLSL